ncbi:HAD-IIB family hydrolase [Mobilitalea sibirica]|uniref:HAD-IIB family hydrolase n=1 Tax=Mobilitalea sibirica TaxID=1462919 RepID=A0A8J7H4C3_9FIRM|nr:HAD-IIB family hydrolase [Mobilitalea sibirica]MBH1942253.1 HAD-IIB family hydrolase [Mobilitalea sibirica]
MKTLYISDLDGTLLQPNVELSANTITILNELMKQGMHFTVATARSLATVKPILADVSIHLPIILMNGVCIYDPMKKDYIKVEYFSKTSREILMALISSHNLKGFAYAIKDGVLATYYEDLSNKALKDFYEERVTKYKKPFTQIESFSRLADDPLIYFSLMDKKEALQQVFEVVSELSDLNCVFYKDNYSKDMWYLEIFSIYASKFHAVQFIRNYLQPETIVCFGDNLNDIPLFNASNRTYAVANAVPELKQKADAIIDRNTQDGVARWLKKNFNLNSDV